MELIATIPVGMLCLLIFLLRVADVALGTMRTVAIVKGHIAAAVLLGFGEVMIWIVAISQVIVRIHESWLLPLAYAGGFAAGNAVGIMLERRLALGVAVVRMLSATRGAEIADALLAAGHAVATFAGESGGGPTTLIYAVAPRRRIRAMLDTARALDPGLLYVSEPAHESNTAGERLSLRPIPLPTGWRAVMKRK